MTPPTAAALPGDRELIAGLIAAQAAAWRRGDAAGYASTAEDDLSFTNIRGKHWIGREPFVTVHERILGGIYAGSTLELAIVHLAFPGTDVAFAEIAVTLREAKGMPPGIQADADGVLRASLLEVFERRAGRWVLVAYHNTATMA